MSINDVLIVGGGPVGLSLGCFLQLKGIKNKIIEKAYSKNTLSKAAGIQPNTMELFEPLCINDEIIERSNLTNRISFVRGNKEILNLNLSKQKTKYSGMYIIGQNEIEEILRNKYLQMGGELLMGAELLNITRHPSDNSLVNCEFITNNIIKNEAYSFIIGCDGVNSKVRSLMGINFDIISNPDRYLIIEGKLDIAIDASSTYCFINNMNQPFAVVPMCNSHYRIVAPFPLSEISTIDYLMKNAKLIPFKDIQVIFDKDTRISEFTVQKRIAETYQKGNVFLAGDAAHVHSPAGAQGMNTGIADAHNLALKISNVLLKRAHYSSLGNYHAERYPIALRMIKGIEKAIQLVLKSNAIKYYFYKLILLFKHDNIVNRIAQLK